MGKGSNASNVPVSLDMERAATGAEPRWSVSNNVASDQIWSTQTVLSTFPPIFLEVVAFWKRYKIVG